MSNPLYRPRLPAYRRPILRTLLDRLSEPSRFIQVISGPRQSGKTTLAQQALELSGMAAHYATADEPGLRDSSWIEAQWETARQLLGAQPSRNVVLALDEIQKIPGWSETMKRLWDADRSLRSRLHVLVLGSAQLLVQRGLSESLAGRFEVIHVPHWSFEEMQTAFRWDLDRYLFFGGYPGAADLTDDVQRWRQYVLESLIETTISRDVLLLTRVNKPALLRQLFRLGCDYSGQIVSFQKLLGQLQDAGNTTTLAHYLELLAGAGMITGLPKFSGSRIRQRGSIPKLLVLNTALMSASSGLEPEEAREDRPFWGRLVESAIGAHLVNSSLGSGLGLSYWRDRGQEVDFVVSDRRRVLALEIKSGQRVASRSGLTAFHKAYPKSRMLIVGAEGIAVEAVLRSTASHLLDTDKGGRLLSAGKRG